MHGSVMQFAGSSAVIDLESPPRPVTSGSAVNPDVPWPIGTRGLASD